MSETVSNGAALSRIQAIRAAIRDLPDPAILPGGVLHWSPALRPGVARADGSEAAAAIEPKQWRWFYHELQAGAAAGSALPTPQEVEARAARLRAEGCVPVAIAHLSYGIAGPALAGALQRFVAEGGAVPMPEHGSFEARTAFFAAPLDREEYRVLRRLPQRHAGLTVRFVVPSDLILGNSGTAPSGFEIDFCDGAGFRAVTPDVPVEVTYADPGERTIRVRATVGGRRLAAGGRFNVTLPSAPTPNEVWTLYSATSYQGVTATGYAFVLYGSGNTALTNPLLLVEGFPGGYSLETLWSDFNEAGLAQSLLDAGYDLVLVGFDDGTTYIEANAGVIVAAIERAISETSADTELVVGGASMGGVVARYALASMETNGQPHQTAIYVSYDSPHLGANVPMSIQGFLQAAYAVTGDGSLGAAVDLLNCAAAQEMLIWWGSMTGMTMSITVSQERKKLISNLAAVGNFPKQPKLIGVSDGAADGTSNGVSSGAVILTASGGTFVSLDTKLAASPGITETINGHEFTNLVCILSMSVYNGIMTVGWGGTEPEYEAAPGGTETFFETLGDKLADADVGFSSKWAHGTACFVPTISALSMSQLSVYDNDDLMGSVEDAQSDFAAWTSGANDPHISVTASTAAWLLQQLPSKLA